MGLYLVLLTQFTEIVLTLEFCYLKFFSFCSSINFIKLIISI